ncbi:stress-activated map kinase interacting protein 1-domain-containing protein [Syncephalis pseudoplumigaleata]|uniref:Stress-activated map kinase interacting protein 1-domain-containing protein n=1 Tax=Syncephalis pseudoplumigaleata TaxID=1712513 RepID=A0A4P9Z4N6_9FUNG|nr:stress-activated map kinase interacting protein 1-domain-containing protein [Syncephalis pseudoplumigaleata]|eukprot:RKP26811.1 stress-activated map kinase interacting protein 1-domain-containing protein [Syncephalis pseudoplumigaleata]
MTLCANKDFIIHQLRINYLRHVEDRAADRVFTFLPEEELLQNPFIRASDDPFNEMAVCYSPDLTSVLSQRMSTDFMGPNGRRRSSVRRSLRHGYAGRAGASGQRIRHPTLARRAERNHAEEPEIDQDEMDIEKPVNRKPLFTKRRIQAGATSTDASAASADAAPSDASDGQGKRGDEGRVVPEAQALSTQDMRTTTNDEDNGAAAPGAEEGEEHELSQAAWTPSSAGTSAFPTQNVKSALTAMINMRRSVVNNPLAAEYASVGGTGSDAIQLKIWLPHSDEPSKPMTVCVKKDATVEDVVGFVLYQYIDQKRQPSLDGKLSIVFWNMRIVEDDGEIDEDLPALERGRQIQKFEVCEFALCLATPEQALRLHKPSKADLLAPMLNAAGIASTHSLGPGRSATTMGGKSDALSVPAANHQGTSGDAGTLAANVSSGSGRAVQPKASSNSLRPAAGASGEARPQRELTIHLHNTLIGYHTTSVSVPLNVPFADILVDICRRWKLEPREYALKFIDTKTDVPNEMTLEQLPDLTELALMKKGSRASGEFAFSTPSDHHRISRTKPKINLTNGLTFMYQRFTVTRRMPMLVGRHERILAIDGEYIHIMPPENRNMFDKMKTTQHGKVSTKFKLVVYRDRDVKTYDLDGATEEDAVEICARINFLMRLHRGESPSTTAVAPAVSGKGAPANVVHANSGFMLVKREDASYDFQWF